MKFLTYSPADCPQRYCAGLYLKQRDAVLPLEAAGLQYESLDEMICSISDTDLSLLKETERCLSQASALTGSDRTDCTQTIALTDKLIPYRSVIRRSPIPFPRQDVICLGINYAAHAEESARFKKEVFERDRAYAVYFSKRVNEAVPDGAAVPCHDDLTAQLDYEAELAVILRKDARNVPAGQASSYIFGYTILNDISAREVQSRHRQWYFGKSLDGFTPMGPWIVTKDEFDDPPVLSIRSHVNGELRQNSNTGMLLFSIPQIIEELSGGLTLKAGTILSTGTPAGAGMGFTPPRFLQKGDTVTCEIEGIGTLTNMIR